MTWLPDRVTWSDRIDTKDESARGIFSPFLNSRDEVLKWGYLGSKGLPWFWIYEYFYCLTERKLCFFVKKPLGFFEYVDVFYEDIVTSEIVRPSFFFLLVTTTASFFVYNFGDILKDEARFLREVGIQVELWMLGPLFLFVGVCSLIPGLLIHSLTYFLFSRPTLTLAAYGSGNLIVASARGELARAFQVIIQEIHRLRGDRDKLDVRDIARGP
jgi:hypothetical protein